MPAVMKLINNLNNINNCFQNGYELRGSMGNRQSSAPVSMNGNSNDGQNHLTRSTTRSRLKEPLTVECNGFANSVSVRSDGVLVEKDTPGRLCRSKSKSCPGNGSQLGPLSPTDGVRPRRNIWKLPSCLLGTTAEDNRSSVIGRTNSITARSKSDSEFKTEMNKTEVSKSNPTSVPCKLSSSSVRGECKLRCDPSSKHEDHNKPDDSPDDKKNTAKGDKKFLEDNREYYKVEVLSTKLRSTRQVVKECESKRHPDESQHKSHIKTEYFEQNGDTSNQSYEDQDLNVRKTRQSHLEEDRLINFSRKKINLRHSFETVRNNDSRVINEMTPVKKSRNCRFSMVERLNMEADKFMFGDPRKELEDMADESSPEIVTPKRKRKSHVELFLIDNLDYYKFELPASRLRNGHDGSKPLRPEFNNPTDCKGTIRLDFDKIQYSFELGIQKELWYQVFLRSRSRTRQLLWQNRVPHQSKILLPFERKAKNLQTSSSKGRNLLPPPPPPPPPLLEPEPVILKKRKRRLSSIADEDKPRKSPRCHASTQAIMSSQHPKRSLYSSNPEQDSYSEFSIRVHDPDQFPECCEFSRTNPYSNDVRKLVDKLSKQLNIDVTQLNLCEVLRDYSRTHYQPCSESNSGGVGGGIGNENSSEFGSSSNHSVDEFYSSNASSCKKLKHKKRRINMTGWPCRPKRKAACKVNYNVNSRSYISTLPNPTYTGLSETTSTAISSTNSATSSSHFEDMSSHTLSSVIENSSPLKLKIKKRKTKASNRYKY